MRLRRNHKLRPQHRDTAIQRCTELLAEAKQLGRDHLWIAQCLYNEFDADCAHIVEVVMARTGAKRDTV